MQAPGTSVSKSRTPRRRTISLKPFSRDYLKVPRRKTSSTTLKHRAPHDFLLEILYLFVMHGSSSRLRTFLKCIEPVSCLKRQSLTITTKWGHHSSMISSTPTICGSRFESQANHLCFLQLFCWNWNWNWYCNEKRTKKRPRSTITSIFSGEMILAKCINLEIVLSTRAAETFSINQNAQTRKLSSKDHAQICLAFKKLPIVLMQYIFDYIEYHVLFMVLKWLVVALPTKIFFNFGLPHGST